jgi:hypothetical protein
MEPALTAACVISVAVLLLLGRAGKRLAAALLRHLPSGLRIVVRFDGAELQILVIWPHARLGRSETGT